MSTSCWKRHIVGVLRPRHAPSRGSCHSLGPFLGGNRGCAPTFKLVNAPRAWAMSSPTATTSSAEQHRTSTAVRVPGWVIARSASTSLRVPPSDPRSRSRHSRNETDLTSMGGRRRTGRSSAGDVPNLHAPSQMRSSSMEGKSERMRKRPGREESHSSFSHWPNWTSHRLRPRGGRRLGEIKTCASGAEGT